MSKIVIPDAVPFVPNGGQLYHLDPIGEPVPISDETAKKLIRTRIRGITPKGSTRSTRHI